jgi:hypothetical protein
MKELPEDQVYCTLTMPSGLLASCDVTEFGELAARLLATCGELFGSKPTINRLVLRVVDTAGKSRRTLGKLESAGELLIIEVVKAKRGRLTKRVQSKTLQIDCWSLSVPSSRKR